MDEVVKDRLEIIYHQADGLGKEELINLAIDLIGRAMRPEDNEAAPYRSRRHYPNWHVNEHLNTLHSRKTAIADLLADLSIPDIKHILSELNRTVTNQTIIPE